MEWEQERYDIKRQLDAALATQRYLEEDLEILQKEIKEKDNKLEELTKCVKEKDALFISSTLEWKNKVENLEELLEAENKKNKVLIENMKEEQETAKTTQTNQDAILLLDIQQLKDKNDVLELDLEKIKSDFEQVVEDRAELAKRSEEIIKMKNDLECALFSKREELTSYIERCTALHEEVALLKVEIDTLKAVPRVHAKKGNSVFAEIDDNRKDLKNSLEELSKKYFESRKTIKLQCAEILKLRNEKSSLQKNVREVYCTFEGYESKLINDYKIRIKELEKNLEYSKRDGNSCQSTQLHAVSNDIRALDAMFEGKRTEIETLKRKIEDLSQTLILQSETIFFLRKDLEVKSAQVSYELLEKMRLEKELNEMNYKE